MKLSRHFIAIAFALTPVILDAQEIAIGNDDNRPVEERIIYNRETTGHVTLDSQELGGGFKIGRIRSIHKTTYWDFEVAYMHSLKQIRLIQYYSTSSFVYGKLNEALIFRAGYEVERRIYGKPYWGGVELRWLYEAGAALALLKPYYYSVVVIKPTSTGEYQQATEYQTFDKSSQWIEILGRAPFTQGLKEIKPRPGLYVKGGLAFEIGTRSTRARSIEVGAMLECFPQGLALMANNPVSRFIPTFYLSFHWGSRYNKY